MSAYEWRCSACKTLLGKIIATGELEIQHKGVVYRVKGQVSTHCRRCQAPATRST